MANHVNTLKHQMLGDEGHEIKKDEADGLFFCIISFTESLNQVSALTLDPKWCAGGILTVTTQCS